jgi:endonuclease YncB( thermonuclease family)
MVSSAYPSYVGTVAAVLDPVTLLVTTGEQSGGVQPLAACSDMPCKVRLVNLDAPSDPALADQAKRNLLKILGKSRRVTLAISSVQETSGVINALVTPENYKKGSWLLEINETQLEAGLATYRSLGTYAVDWYIDCRLKRAEDRARAARRGVWAKPWSR